LYNELLRSDVASPGQPVFVVFLLEIEVPGYYRCMQDHFSLKSVTPLFLE